MRFSCTYSKYILRKPQITLLGDVNVIEKALKNWQHYSMFSFVDLKLSIRSAAGRRNMILNVFIQAIKNIIIIYI